MKGWSVWVEPSGDGRWRCRWRGKFGSGQQTFLYKADADELEEHQKRAFEREGAGLSPLPGRAARIRVAEAAGIYLVTRQKGVAPNTYIKDKEATDQFVEFAGDVVLADIPAEPIPTSMYAWTDWLYSQKDYGSTTVRMRLSHLRTFFRWCMNRGWMGKNPLDFMKLPKSNKRGRVLTDEEVNTALSIPPRKIALAFTLLLNSGMRKGELLALEKKRVIVRPPGEPSTARFDSLGTKNRKAKVVILNEAARAAVIEAMADSQTEYVFDVGADTLDKWIWKVSEFIGPVMLHDFKHTFCTRWMERTGDFSGLQKMTGNSAASLMCYLHLGQEAPHGLRKFTGFAPPVPLNAVLP